MKIITFEDADNNPQFQEALDKIYPRKDAEYNWFCNNAFMGDGPDGEGEPIGFDYDWVMEQAKKRG
jgi:hypothetical protein